MFTITELANNKVLITGTDIRNVTGEQVVDTTEWNRFKQTSVYEAAVAKVDDAIAQLVAPIQAAIDEANELVKKPELDPLLYVVEQEGDEGTPAQRRIVSKLSQDSVILRAIEEGEWHRLLWVAGKLELSAATWPTPTQQPLF